MKRCRVVWFVGAVKYGKYKFNLAYCTYGKGFAFIKPHNDVMSVLLIDDVTIYEENGKTVCADAEYCLNTACKLSRPNPSYIFAGFAKTAKIKGRDLEKAMNNLVKVAKYCTENLPEAFPNFDPCKEKYRGFFLKKPVFIFSYR